MYVHCWGGIGRTGTVVGCLLAADGMDCDQLLAAIAALREGTRKAAAPEPRIRRAGRGAPGLVGPGVLTGQSTAARTARTRPSLRGSPVSKRRSFIT